MTVDTELLKRIPHLRLPIHLDTDALTSEVCGLSNELVGYELPKDKPEEQKRRYREGWRGLGLVDYEADPTKGMTDARTFRGEPPPFDFKYDATGNPKFFNTGLEPQLPTVYDTIYRIFKNPERCRISCISAGASIFWHSHHLFYSGNYESVSEYKIAIVQIPIITNPDVRFGVTRFPNQEHGINPFWQHYSVGEAWLFNSWHDHNVGNNGVVDRTHLMLYGTLDDELLSPVIESALSTYTGATFDV